MFGSKVMKIEKKQGLFAWEVDLNGASKKQEISIENGLQCVKFVNGIKGESLYSTSAKTVLNLNEGEVKLIAVDIKGIHKLRCGCGDVAFTDYEVNIEGKVGMNATVSVAVVNASRFVEIFSGVNEVKETTVEDYLREKFGQALKLALKETINQFGRDAENQLFKLNEQLKAYLQPSMQNIGLQIETFNINGIHFDEDYEQARKEYFEKKEQDRLKRKAQREEQEEQDRELDVLERISKMGKKKETVIVKEEQGVYCSICGHKNRFGSTFCEKCGNKIKK